MNEEQKYVGMSEENAVRALEADQKKYRVIQRDDEHFLLTQDYDPTRLNLILKEGRVVDVQIG